jgi:hypothetical protein
VTPRLRNAALTAHITCSVGWLGAVVAFLAIAVVALTSDDAATVRGAYLVMEPAAWFALVPLAFASLLTGLIQSLSTVWGLFRHYWIVFKLAINVVANAILLLYTQTLADLAGTARGRNGDLDLLRTPSVLLHAIAALLLLLVATVLAVYKPRGLTPYGRRKQRERQRAGRVSA